MLNVFQVSRDMYESATDQGDGTFHLMSIPGRPWVVNRPQFFKNKMQQLGYDIEALEGQTLVLAGCATVKVENGMVIVLKDNCPNLDDPEDSSGQEL